MQPTAAKWVALTTLGLVSFALGMLPIKISSALKWTRHGCQRSPASQLLLSAMLCFGAGVLLATALTHMLPEVRANVEELMEQPGYPPFLKRLPLTEVLLATGFFIVYGLDELVHSSLYRRQHQHSTVVVPEPADASSGLRTSGHHSHSHCPPAGMVAQEPRPNAANSLIRNTSGLHHYGATECHSKHDVPDSKGYKILDEEVETSVERTLTESHQHGQASHSHSHSHAHSHASPEKHQHNDEEPLTATSGFLALVALSIHAVTEGLAIGLQASTANVFFLLAAVCTHKFVIAFCLGMEMSSGWGASRTTLKFHAIFMAVFSGMSALGILIGLLLMGSDEPEGLFIQALQALAAGTLLYVTFFEVLPRERAKCHAGLLQYAAVLSGFSIMLTLDTLVPHSDDDLNGGLLNSTSVQVEPI